MKVMSCLLALLTLLALPAAGCATDTIERATIELDGSERVYHLFAPQRATQPTPLLVLLHGSFQKGNELLEAWTSLAADQGIVLVAPDALDWRWWRIRYDGPGFIHAVVEAVADRYSVDRQRIYLFGISGGAVHALTIAMLESEYFAATAVFAGSWRDKKSYLALDAARRKIPVAIHIGDRDQFFSLDSVRRTEAALRKAGHPVTVNIIRRQDHSYADVASRVNREAWEFLSTVVLDVEPRYVIYD